MAKICRANRRRITSESWGGGGFTVNFKVDRLCNLTWSPFLESDQDLMHFWHTQQSSLAFSKSEIIIQDRQDCSKTATIIATSNGWQSRSTHSKGNASMLLTPLLASCTVCPIVHCSAVMITIVHWVIYSTIRLLHSPCLQVLQCTFRLLQYKKWGKPGTCLRWPKFAELTGNASHLLEATEKRGGRLGMKKVSVHC